MRSLSKTYQMLVALAISVCLFPACKPTFSGMKPSYAAWRAQQPQLDNPIDYSLDRTWAALPSLRDSADCVPEATAFPAIATESAAVDVFWLYPTIYYNTDNWIAPMPNDSLDRAIDASPIKYQANIFNAAGAIYAPRYRQMSFNGFFDEDSASWMAALDFAYADVKSAFEYYLKHHNHGRPIILASHSQGTVHAIRLLHEYFDGKPLQAQLVAAYAVGFPFDAAQVSHIPICETPTQTGCIVSWSTYRHRHIPDNYSSFHKKTPQVNPITWSRNEKKSVKSAHKGILLRKPYRIIRSGQLSAQIHGSILWCKGFGGGLFIANYHMGDYNLFWENVRENAVQRAQAFSQQAQTKR